MVKPNPWDGRDDELDAFVESLDVGDDADPVRNDEIDQDARVRKLKGDHVHARQAAALRKRIVFLVAQGKTPKQAVDTLNEELAAEGNGERVSSDQYRQWRKRWPMFKHAVDSARLSAPELQVGWKGGFAKFRKAYFGMDSPWFHLEVIDAIEHAAPGSITLILLPPEHGKTTLMEDFISYKLAVDPSYRFMYGSERVDHGMKVGARVRGRMEEDGSAVEYVATFGPFAPQTGENRNDRRKTQQPWGEKKWSVYKKGSHDERDYSFVALGIGAAVAGTRTDRLIIDDVQSLKSINLTKKIVEMLRQDWFSRPGSKGATILVGTRVGDDDVYEVLMNQVRPNGKPLLDRVIVYPAVRTDIDTDEKVYLWPERYSPEEYELMEGTVGADAWSRNYQQAPRATSESTFTAETLANATDGLRSWVTPPPTDHTSIMIGIDPALGGQNAFVAAACGPRSLTVLDSQGDWGLTRTEQIIAILAEFLARYSGQGLPVSDVVIEEMAFQRGLPNDERLLELKRQYGFHIRPHQTGHNKNDPDLGVSGMALSFMRREIILPGATDDMTKARIGPLVEELGKWRPSRGTKLKQDRVMALWFVWLQWRQRKSQLLADPSRFRGEGLPFPSMVRPTTLTPTPMPGLARR